MRNNVVVDGVSVKELLDSIQKMLNSGTIENDTVVTIDVFDGYRHGIQKMFLENDGILTFGAKIHDDF